MQKAISAQEWVSLLCNAVQRSPKVAVPTRAHGTIRLRGTTSCRTLAEVMERLLAQPVPIRLEVVQELIRAADDRALAVLRALAIEQRDPDGDIRWSIAEGLSKIAQPGAVKLLEILAREDPDETVRTRAIGSLGESALAAYRAQVGVEKATPRELVRVRGTIRTRGRSPVRQASPAAQAILDLLYKLRDEEPSDYVKSIADVTLRQLGE